MECHLRNCCRWTPMIGFSLVLCFGLISIAAADSLQSSNNDRSSFPANGEWVQSGNDESSSAAVGDSIEPNEDRLPLWELPIVTAPACDLLKPEGSGAVVAGRTCRDDDVADDANADGDRGAFEKEESEEAKQGAVSCDVTCFRADPVCGEDAITYWCGVAEAKCAGVEVAYTGYCDARSGGAGKDSTRAAQSLYLVHFIWLILAGFLVIADLL